MNKSQKPGFKEVKYLLEELSGLKNYSCLSLDKEKEQARILSEQIKKDINDAALSPLCIGIFGGSGAGKSSLLNILAGSTISISSPKRPFTELAHAYYHRDCIPDLKAPENFLATPVIHDIDAIRHLALFDLPDFDSLIKSHRNAVVALAQDMDICLFLTTPEKYADRAMFDIMKTLQKSDINYIFAINKCDQIQEDQLFSVAGHFHALLDEAGLPHARVFTISIYDAENARDTIGARGFSDLSTWIFKKREEKEIQAIRSANTFKDATVFFSQLKNRLAGDNAPEMLMETMGEVENNLYEIEQRVEADILDAIVPDFQNIYMNILLSASSFLWQVALVAPVAGAGSKNRPEKKVEEAAHPLFESNLSAMDRIMNAALTGFSAAPRPESLKNILNNFIKTHKNLMEGASLPGFFGKAGFIIRQWVFLSVPTFFFLAFMTGYDGGAINWKDIVAGLWALPFALFTTKGLAAMLALIIIWLIISIRLAATRRVWATKLTKKAARQLSRTLAQELNHELKSSLNPLKKWTEDALEEKQKLTGVLPWISDVRANQKDVF